MHRLSFWEGVCVGGGGVLYFSAVLGQLSELKICNVTFISSIKV